MEHTPKLCDECKSGTRLYADGYVFTDWSDVYTGNPKELPKTPDQSKFWTYIVCNKNNKSFQFVNLDGNCKGYAKK